MGAAFLPMQHPLQLWERRKKLFAQNFLRVLWRLDVGLDAMVLKNSAGCGSGPNYLNQGTSKCGNPLF